MCYINFNESKLHLLISTLITSKLNVLPVYKYIYLNLRQGVHPDYVGYVFS